MGQKEIYTAVSPTIVPVILLAPTGLLKLIKCSCRSEMPCKTNQCTLLFCACQGWYAWKNETVKKKQKKRT